MKAESPLFSPAKDPKYVGMGKELYDNFSVAREVFEEADDTLHFSISALCFQGPEEALKLTENTQPAILTTSIAALRVLQAEKGMTPQFAAGHSLGEYSALVASGALAFAEAVEDCPSPREDLCRRLFLWEKGRWPPSSVWSGSRLKNFVRRFHLERFSLLPILTVRVKSSSPVIRRRLSGQSRE